MASGTNPDPRARHPREFPPSNGASASHIAARSRKPGKLPTRRGRIARPALLFAGLHADRFAQELAPFLRFPSISNSPKHRLDVRKCAEWLAAHLNRIGLPSVQVVQTAGHPIVVASSAHIEGRPTLLVYGHYDVQPVDPIKKWRTPPFTPVRRGENLVARGASDDKGQLFIHVKAVESYLASRRSLPLNVKCIFEGEEEIGSPHFAEFLRKNVESLRANFGVISDTRMLAPDKPAIIYGQRGMLSLELTVQGARQDLHSGAYGGAIHNPAQALAEILSQLHRKCGRINIPGFYARVRKSSAEEREYFSANAPDNAKLLADAGSSRGWGESGYSLFERTTIRPALTINGIQGGYRGPGGKGIIPSRASAKISFRLVPDQNPEEIESMFRNHLRQIASPTVKIFVRTISRARPVLINPAHPANRAAAWAYRKAFGVDPVFLRSGGTISVMNTLSEVLGIPIVLMGFALPDDGMHAPNEKMYLPNFHRGVATSIWFMSALGTLRRREWEG